MLRAGDQGAPAAAWRTSTRCGARRSPTDSGSPAPEPTIELVDLEPSPALSQIGGPLPPDGRMVGIVVDPDGDLSGVDAVRRGGLSTPAWWRWSSARTADLVGLPIVQRTFATGRSVELDAACSPAPPPIRGWCCCSMRALRHAKVIGGWGDGLQSLETAGYLESPGVVRGDTAAEVFAEVLEQMAFHRAWERFPA